MGISRRSFLKYGLATVALGGAAIVGSKLVKKLLQEEEKPITFYVSLKPDTQYSQESFDLARNYFKERIGLDVNFVYCDKNKTPELNHLNRFALVETSDEERVNKRYFQVVKTDKYDSEYREKPDNWLDKLPEETDLDRELKRRIKKAVEEGTRKEREELEQTKRRNIKRIKEFHKGLRKYFEKAYKNTTGEVDLENSSVYLLPLEKYIERYGKEDSKRYATQLIVHEIGHLAGLWHSFQYENDKVEDRINEKTTNVMSYEPVGQGKYGFDMIPEQIKQVQDYFRAGETYKRLQNHDFKFNKFVDAVAKERGYK